MDLPTYTNIWRIEKRLYKLYDFRLPMPLPIGQLTVFAAIAVPYVVLLTVLGLPFNHKLIWLYVLPPGVLTWLATRPVLESKRLPELVVSQLRYLAEPRVWCRMAPLAEKDVVVVTGRVWRHARAARRPAAATAPAIASAARRRRPAGVSRPRSGRPAPGPAGLAPSRPAGQLAARAAGSPRSWMPGKSAARPAGPPARPAGPAAWPGGPAAQTARSAAPPARAASPPARAVSPGRLTPAGGWPSGLAPAQSGRPADTRPHGPLPVAGGAPPDVVRGGGPVPAAGVSRSAAGRADGSVPVGGGVPDVVRGGGPAAGRTARTAPGRQAVAGSSGGDGGERPASARRTAPGPDEAVEALAPEAAGAAPVSAGPQRGVVTVVGAGPGRTAPPAVERALAGPSAHRGDARPGRVLVVPGGHRPGKPDQLQRDRSRAQLPIAGPSRIVVLGCTVGAGQTITALMIGEVLASLRADQVAVLDLNPGERSLAQRAKARPALNQAASLGPSRLEVLSQEQVIGRRQDGGTGGQAPARGQDGGTGGQAPARGQDGGTGELAPSGGPADDARAVELASTRYPLVLADPSTSAVPRLLAIADLLVLVAPASAAAAGAIAMTFEWLEAHGQAGLAGSAIMVMNGVSRRTMSHVEQAERVAAGRCRAIVRVPWDDQLQDPAAKQGRPTTPGAAAGQQATDQFSAVQPGAVQPGAVQPGPRRHGAGAGQYWAGLLSPPTAGAYTALAGVLVAALAVPSDQSGQHGQSGPLGQSVPSDRSGQRSQDGPRGKHSKSEQAGR